MQFVRRFVFRVATLATLAALVAAPAVSTDAMEGPPTAESAETFVLADLPDGFVMTMEDGVAGCREATLEESRLMAERDQSALHVITPERASKVGEADGMKIVLRATEQLERFPDAKAAFLRAAAEWESLLADPITIIIDVDFGPERFGQPFGGSTLGSTQSQQMGSSAGYDNLRTMLIEGASSAEERAVYEALPEGILQTDRGGSSYVFNASAALRAIGLIRPDANPGLEFGNPPSIGFNSAFDFDFDPSDGIDPGRTDFNGVVLHEIGHVLGFSSFVGLSEQSSNPNLFTVLDMFRFRPGITIQTIGTSQQVLSSGGTHVFFAGGEELELSTGRNDGSGGDGRQASHWKDDAFVGTRIGVMDPTIGRGDRVLITENDLHAFDRFGYELFETKPIGISDLDATLRGDTLTVSGLASNTEDAAVTSARVLLRDTEGAVLATREVDLDVGGPNGPFSIAVDGLADLPAAIRGRLVLFDAEGNASLPVVLDFSAGDEGGPLITKFKLKKNGKFKLIGKQFSDTIQLEVNGEVVPLPPGAKVNKKGTKITINLSQLNLRPGANRIRVLDAGLQSNILVLSV